jgi:bifunctional non-homologous end joining protein LigD
MARISSASRSRCASASSRRLLRNALVGLQLNEHLEHEDGAVVFRHACKMGLEGIVSKRLGSPYRSGRSRHWIKSKNPKHPALKREHPVNH